MNINGTVQDITKFKSIMSINFIMSINKLFEFLKGLLCVSLISVGNFKFEGHQFINWGVLHMLKYILKKK